MSGGQYIDRLAQTRRPHGAVSRAHARDVWPDHRDEFRVGQSLPLAGAERMPGLPRSQLACARLPPVSQWAVRASLDALDSSPLSRRARPYGFRSASYAEYTGRMADLSRVTWRGGDGYTHPTLPLPAGVQPPAAPTDQMGGLRHRCAHQSHVGLWDPHGDRRRSVCPGGEHSGYTVAYVWGFPHCVTCHWPGRGPLSTTPNSPARSEEHTSE